MKLISPSQKSPNTKFINIQYMKLFSLKTFASLFMNDKTLMTKQALY